MWTALSGAPWWQRSGVPSTPFTHDERGHQQAPARGVDGEDSTQPKAGTVLVRMRKHCTTCAGSSHGLVSSRRSLDLGDGFVKDHWSVKGVDGPKRQRSGVAKAGRVMHLGAWSQQSLAIEESDVQDS